MRDDHSHTVAARNSSASSTTTTLISQTPPPDLALTSQDHDACLDVPRSTVAKALGAGAAKNSLVASTVEVDPGWQTAPAYAGCIWTYYGKRNVKQLNVVELFVASFSTATRAVKFYDTQLSGYQGVPVKSLVHLSIGKAATFVPQPAGRYGGAVTVMSGRTTVRVESLVRSQPVSRMQTLATLESLALSALHHATSH